MLEILALCSCACIVCIWCTAAIGSTRTKHCLRRVLLLTDSKKYFHSCTKCCSQSCTSFSKSLHKKRKSKRNFPCPNLRQRKKSKSSTHKNSYNRSSRNLSSTSEGHCECKCGKELNNLKEGLQETKDCVTMHRNLPVFDEHPCCEMRSHHLGPTFNNENSSKTNFLINYVKPGEKSALTQKSSFYSLSRSFAETHAYCHRKQPLYDEEFRKFQKTFKPMSSAVLNAQTQYSTPECVGKSSSEATVNLPLKNKSIPPSSCGHSNYSPPFKRVPWTSYNSRSASFSHMMQTPPSFLNYKLMCKVCLQEKYRCICSKIYYG